MSEQSIQAAEVASDTEFGGGDLGRVQALLFGDHARQTRERVDTLEQALLGAIADLRADMGQQLDQLEVRLSNEAENRSTAMSNLGDRLTEEVKTLTKTDRSLERNLTKTGEKLHAAIDRSSASAQAAIDLARKDLSTEIQRTNSTLRDNNVDRSALAGMMAAVAEQLADDSKEGS